MKRGTQTWLASSVQKSTGFISDILSGRAKCPPDLADRLGTISGIPRDVWVWGTPEELRTALDKQFPKKEANKVGF